MCAAKSNVRFTPHSDRESGIPAKVMSALPPKADIDLKIAARQQRVIGPQIVREAAT